jgi:hypothetical protein
MNRQAVDTEAVARAYSELLGRYTEPGEPPEESAAMAPSRADYLKSFLYGLNPTLRAQFLSLAFTHCSENENTRDLDKLFEKMDAYLILKMLDQANREHREISPGMINMIRKVVAGAAPERREPPGETLRPRAETLQNLFNREKYEKYVEQDYDTVLKKLAVTSTAGHPVPGGIDLDLETEALNDRRIDLKFLRLLTRLMKASPDAEAYTPLARAAVRTSETLADRGAPPALSMTVGLFRAHGLRHPCPGIRPVAARFLEAFRQPDQVRRLLTLLIRDQPQDSRKHLCRSLTALGPSIIPTVVAWCAYKADLDRHPAVLGLLPKLGGPVSREVEGMLSHQDPLLLRNMVLILRTAGGPESVSLLTRLHVHPVPDVRMAALEASVLLGDPAGEKALLDLAASDNAGLTLRAVTLAGRLGMERAVPVLMSRFRMSLGSRECLEKNEVILHALGAIGSRQSLPLLKRILSSSWTLHPGGLARLQMAALRSLSGYPPDERAILARLCLKSRNSDVRGLCGDLLQGGGKTGGPSDGDGHEQ